MKQLDEVQIEHHNEEGRGLETLNVVNAVLEPPSSQRAAVKGIWGQHSDQYRFRSVEGD